jgi:crotonobetainyl-CoA:carnitine CoA-transferase CaiB-like acyl-CoA transferase
MSSPLEGLRILDLTTVVMGPYATQVLADYGADVIKVESPTGDTTRQIPPMRHPDMGCQFLHLNRNKRSLLLDLKDPEAVAALVEVAATCDVFIANVRPAALARLGITYEALTARRPDLIWISLVGFGSNGPYAGQPAYDDLIQSLTAIPAMLVQAGSGHPHYVPLSFNDRAVGLHAAIALLAAVRHRDRTGEGQFVEVPMLETMAQFTLGDHVGGHTFDPPIGPPGYKRTLTPERHPYATLDGYVSAIIYTDRHWRSFLEMVGEPDRFASDPRVGSLLARTEHADELYREVGERLRQRPTSDWLAAFAAADIPAVPLHDLESALYDPHLVAAGFFQVSEHPTEGPIRELGVPTTWSASDIPKPAPAPSLGEHTAEILREAGIGDATIERLGRPPRPAAAGVATQAEDG